MIGYYRSEDMVALDQRLAGLGVSSAVLMENVGREIAEKLASRFPEPPGLCLICAGPGSNGGDGFVIARHLALRGWETLTILSHPKERSLAAAGENLKLLELQALPTLQSTEQSDQDLAAIFRRAAVVIDALLGTGASGAPRGEVGRLIDLINGSPAFRVAVDLPSGVEAGGSRCVRAQVTFTAVAPKTLLATGKGALLAGKVVPVSLGLKAESLMPKASALEPETSDLKSWMPQRYQDDHKGCRGGVLIVAGSLRYRGAALLAARGALRAGAGLVVLASPEPVLSAGAGQLPEIIGEVLDEPSQLLSILERWQNRCSVVLVGPGLDRDQRAQEICRTLRAWQGARFSLWDGDGLFWIAQEGEPQGPFGLTPHEGEAAKLLRLAVSDISAQRLRSADLLAQCFGPVILKGYRSVVASPEVPPLVIAAGDRSLSVPGSGDVLAGAAAAMIAAGLIPQRAMALAAWIHGKAGERLGACQGQDGLLASQIADGLPWILKDLSS